MGEISDIKDRDSLKAWLMDQPREVSVWIAARAAARVLPMWWEASQLRWGFPNSGQVVLLLLHSVFRASTFRAFGAISYRPDAESFRQHQSDAPNLAGLDAVISARSHGYEVYRACKSAVSAGRTIVAPTTAAPHGADAAEAAADALSDIWKTVRMDAEVPIDGAVPAVVPLWPEDRGPLAETWEAIKAQVSEAEDAANWTFWIAWYDALLDGRPMLGDAARTLEMLERIALIDPEIWEKGSAVVNPVIREIWELHRLRAEVAALQAEKEAFLAARASEVKRGHNQPPEGLVDDAPEVARQITIIWDGLDEAREELEQEVPDKGRLRAIAGAILSALTSVAQYCGKLVDTSLMSAAKWSGPVIGTAVFDQIVNNGRLMQFAKDLLNFGSGG